MLLDAYNTDIRVRYRKLLYLLVRCSVVVQNYTTWDDKPHLWSSPCQMEMVHLRCLVLSILATTKQIKFKSL